MLLCIIFAGTQSLHAQHHDYEMILQNHIQAFNKKDLNSLVENVTNDFVWFYVTDNSIEKEVSGKDAFKKTMAAYFQDFNETKASISEIIQSGIFITFKETVNWGTNNQVQSSIAVYQFEGNKISRVWYFPSQ